MHAERALCASASREGAIPATEPVHHAECPLTNIMLTVAECPLTNIMLTVPSIGKCPVRGSGWLYWRSRRSWSTSSKRRLLTNSSSTLATPSRRLWTQLSPSCEKRQRQQNLISDKICEAMGSRLTSTIQGVLDAELQRANR